MFAWVISPLSISYFIQRGMWTYFLLNWMPVNSQVLFAKRVTIESSLTLANHEIVLIEASRESFIVKYSKNHPISSRRFDCWIVGVTTKTASPTSLDLSWRSGYYSTTLRVFLNWNQIPLSTLPLLLFSDDLHVILLETRKKYMGIFRREVLSVQEPRSELFVRKKDAPRGYAY